MSQFQHVPNTADMKVEMLMQEEINLALQSLARVLATLKRLDKTLTGLLFIENGGARYLMKQVLLDGVMCWTLFYILLEGIFINLLEMMSTVDHLIVS